MTFLGIVPAHFYFQFVARQPKSGYCLPVLYVFLRLLDRIPFVCWLCISCSFSSYCPALPLCHVLCVAWLPRRFEKNFVGPPYSFGYQMRFIDTVTIEEGV